MVSFSSLLIRERGFVEIQSVSFENTAGETGIAMMPTFIKANPWRKCSLELENENKMIPI